VTTSTAFVISPIFGESLISEGTALALGIDTVGLPLTTVETYFGDVTVPTALIDFQLVPGLAPTSEAFGILPDSLNPTGLSVLGSDVLDIYDAYSIDTVNDLFTVMPAPEPTTLFLLGSGVLVAGVRRRRWNRRPLLRVE
jgi:hypothetical protein